MSRRDLWRVELLNQRDQVKHRLDGVKGGKLHWSVFKAVAGSGSVELDVLPGVEIDWLRDRIRITHVNGPVETPFGIWLISKPGWTREGPVTSTTIDLADKTELLNSPLGESVTVPAGVGVVGYVTGLVRGRGESALQVTPSSLTTRTARTWDYDDTWLTLANDLLATINYASLSADMSGRLVVEPYVAPGDRVPVGTYGPERDDLLLRESWSDEADIFSLPTGVRIHVEGDDETPGFIGRFDLPASDPLSAASRGTPDIPLDVLHVEDAEAADQATADAIAERRLGELLQVTRRVSVTHPVDTTSVNDVVTHRPLGLQAAIVERSVELGAGAVVQDTIRHIYTGGEMPWPV